MRPVHTWAVIHDREVHLDGAAIFTQAETAIPGWRISRMQTALSGPLAIVATGGTFALAVLWARLHESLGWPAWAVTPADFCDRPLPAHTQVLILSASGRHHDILRAARHAKDPFAIVCDRSAPLCDLVRAGSGDALILPHAPVRGMGDYRQTLGFLNILARWHECARHVRPLFEQPMPALPKARPRHVITLGTGLAGAAAADLANRCRESGVATARASDLRDIAHGDLLAATLDQTWLVFFGGDAAYRQLYLDRLPPGLTRLVVTSSQTGALMGLDLMVQAGRLGWAMQDRFDAHPSISALPEWLKDLYRLSHPA